MKILSYKNLNKKDKELIDAAQEAIKLGYNPYKSKTLVGAAVRTKSNKIIIGGCFGNASSTFNICAERSAILTANNLGERNIKEIALIGFSKNKPFHKPVTPCGICRQVIFEITKITKKDVIVWCVNQNKSKILKTSITELLPQPY
ncbi:MAG: cytidine deaminase [Patescibacteria group bacterium]